MKWQTTRKSENQKVALQYMPQLTQGSFRLEQPGVKGYICVDKEGLCLAGELDSST